MRIVLDTASFVAAVRSSDGAAGEIVRMIFRREIVPLMDLKLSLEYHAVAARPEHIAASLLSEDEVRGLIVAVEAFAEAVDILLKIRPLSNDPSDDMILDLSLNGHADALVTTNIRHFAAAGKLLRIPVLTPAELLRSIRKGRQDVN